MEKDKKDVKELETYVNINGFPIIRRCKNCIFWNDETDFNLLGYCKFKPMYFAFTLQPTVYPMTKEFYLCENHQFPEENRLEQVCDKVLLKDILKKKEDIKKN